MDYSTEICIGCGCLEKDVQHPVFHGGLCAPCKEMFLETYFLYDDSGSASYCLICSAGKTVLICDAQTCSRCYCLECLDILVGPGTSKQARSLERWICFLCLPRDSYGLLKRRRKWRTKLKALYDQEYGKLKIFKTFSAWQRKPMHVLSLFSDISRELTELGFLGPDSDDGRLTYVLEVSNIKRTNVQQYGPVDFVFGATPRNGTIFNHCSAWYFYQFYRLLSYARPIEDSDRPFFWMFVDNLVLEDEVSDAATFRFFETNPLTVYDVKNGAVVSAVQVWGNIPSLNSKYSAPLWTVDMIQLRENLMKTNYMGTRLAKLIKKFFNPMKEYFRCVPAEDVHYP
ncbi:DNA (cytosine-5)-methyltransferase 3-like [Ambystoma mexicanum]|uniref:DNA (cytosine-5)-methyltransferase 3-like n=1 Tax=Ambystoma mexicanum TaxID=8296 RepID=UPI0037E8FA6F